MAVVVVELVIVVDCCKNGNSVVWGWGLVLSGVNGVECQCYLVVMVFCTVTGVY